MCTPVSVPAGLRLPALFSEGMVLQRDLPVRVWGWAGEGASVHVSFRDVVATAETRGGRWEVTLPAQAAGGPWPMHIRAGEVEITLNEVYVGEVWLCSGQSNMVMPLARRYVGYTVRGGAEAAAQSDDPLLRLFTVAENPSPVPRDDVGGRWLASAPETAGAFSATGYFFGRELRRVLDVPVGLILAARGGSPMEVWMDSAVLERNHPARLAFLRQRWDAYEEALGAGETPPRVFRASEYYYGMIAPLIPYALRGVIWYQGESNVGTRALFVPMFGDLIAQWRAAWGLGDFPFLFVQLAPYGDLPAEPVQSAWAETRVAQARVASSVPNTAMIGTMDLGDDPGNPHPVEKETVGLRLAAAARALAYGEDVPYRGPEAAGMRVQGEEALVSFAHAGDGLVTPAGEPVRGFALAGEDGRFRLAEAVIRGDTVRVSHPDIPDPASVRYGWADYPDANLFNRAGLPALPFHITRTTRTERDDDAKSAR